MAENTVNLMIQFPDGHHAEFEDMDKKNIYLGFELKKQGIAYRVASIDDRDPDTWVVVAELVN